MSKTAYEVSLSIDAEIADAYSRWLPGHVRRMLEIDGFETAQVFQEETSDASRTHLTVMYIVSSRAHLERYFESQAASMRQEAIDLFGTQFSARRRIFLVLE